ncbi:hypothetical protein [Lacinutrix salivirga]
MRKIILVVILITSFKAIGQNNDFFQYSYRSQGAKVAGAYYNIGENSFGYNAFLGFHFLDGLSFNAIVGKRKFELRNYSENILEVGGEINLMVWSINERRLTSSVLYGFNVSVSIGGMTEFVNNSSQVILADPYPKLSYITGGIYLESSLIETLKIAAYARQWYGFGQDTVTIGNKRYDIGLGLRYYFL